MGGKQRDLDDMLQAVMHCGGDLSVFAKALGTSSGSARNYLYRYPELMEIWKSQRGEMDAEKAVDKVAVNGAEEAASDEVVILSESQKRVLDDIDASGRGGWANVDNVPTTLLLKMEGWGLLEAKKEAGNWFARLTDDGEIALLGGEIKPKAKPTVELKPAVGKPTNGPKKTGGWNSHRTQKESAADWSDAEPSNENGASHEISDIIGQEVSNQEENATWQPIASNPNDCADCRECLHREVLEYIMERVPDAKELYEQVAAKKKAEAEMAAILKKFGG
jgi:hypothetical protein